MMPVVKAGLEKPLKTPPSRAGGAWRAQHCQVLLVLAVLKEPGKAKMWPLPFVRCQVARSGPGDGCLPLRGLFTPFSLNNKALNVNF